MAKSLKKINLPEDPKNIDEVVKWAVKIAESLKAYVLNLEDYLQAADRNVKTIAFSVQNPDQLSVHSTRNTKCLCAWFNNTGYDLKIREILAISDINNYTFLLFKSNSETDIGVDDDVQIDSVVCGTAGTSGYYSKIESGFDNQVIEKGKWLIFEHSSGTAKNVIVHIRGDLMAN